MQSCDCIRAFCCYIEIQAEGVCDGADEDDGRKERAEEADHGVEDLLPSERASVQQ